jgi:hypothetical protein
MHGLVPRQPTSFDDACQPALRRFEIASQAVIPQLGMVPTFSIAVTTNVQQGGVVQEVRSLAKPSQDGGAQPA